MNETLKILIENYCHLHDINCKTLQNRFIPIQDFNKTYNFKNSVAFFYKFCANGIIKNVSDLRLPVCKVKTYNQTINYNEIVNIKDSGIVQNVESNFVYVVDNYAEISLFSGENAMFNTLYNANLQYISLIKNS